MHRPSPTSFVLRPVVIVVLVYVVLVSIWGIWTLLTVQAPESGETGRMLSRTALVLVTATHAVLLVALAVDGLLALRSGPGMRRGHLTGVALSIVVLAVLQWGAVLAHRPFS